MVSLIQFPIRLKCKKTNQWMAGISRGVQTFEEKMLKPSVSRLPLTTIQVSEEVEEAEEASVATEVAEVVPIIMVVEEEEATPTGEVVTVANLIMMISTTAIQVEVEAEVPAKITTEEEAVEASRRTTVVWQRRLRRIWWLASPLIIARL